MSDCGRARLNDVERLVEAGRDGDRGAFDELVRMHRRRAMATAVRMLGSADEAAEAVQEGFVRAWVNIDKLKEPKRFEFWLLRIITNAAISQRRAGRRRHRQVSIAEDYPDERSSSLIDKTVGHELKDAMQGAMLKLSKKEAKAISLFGLEDFSHAEVAGVMGCSAGAAKWYVFRARQKLKVLLKEYL